MTASNACPECAASLLRVLDKVAEMPDLSGAQWAKVSNLIHAELQGRGAGQQPASSAADAGQWAELVRYGLQWNGPREFVCTPMADGYWTPWHIAQSALTAITTERDALRRAIAEPAPDIQESVLRKLGVQEQLAAAQQRIERLEQQRADLIATTAERIRGLESLLATRNQQNAACWTDRDELQRDAARYRYLRNQEGLPTPEEFDRMVDADMTMAAEGDHDLYPEPPQHDDLRRDLEEARDELASLREQVRWRPMEGAPKDGSHVLLYRPHIRFVGYHSDAGWCINAPGLPLMQPEPTGWMPLPEIGPLPGGDV